MKTPTTRIITVVTVLVGLPVFLGAGYLILMQGEKNAPPAEEPVVENPFEGLPAETPPTPQGADAE